MKWRQWTACLSVVVSLGAGCGRRESSLFPTEKGRAWSYSGDVDNVAVASEARVVSSKQEDDHQIVHIGWTQGGKPSQDETYQVNRDEIARVSSGRGGITSLEPPMPILKLPLEAGKRWTWEGSVKESGLADLRGSAVFNVVAKEMIKTGAGEFEAFRVGMSMQIWHPSRPEVAQTNSATVWYAPGVGIVKQLTDQLTPAGQKREASRVLVKYASGEK